MGKDGEIHIAHRTFIKKRKKKKIVQYIGTYKNNTKK